MPFLEAKDLLVNLALDLPLMETVKRSVVARSWGLGGRGRKDIPLWFEMLMVGEAVGMGRRYIGTLCTFHSIL